MNKRKLPFNAWRLMPSGKPVEVTLVSVEDYFDNLFYTDERGKMHRGDKIYESRDAAISAGLTEVAEQQERITKMQFTLDKRRAALEKAR